MQSKEAKTMLCGSVDPHGDTLFNKRGKGSGDFFYSSLLHCSVQWRDQSQRSILSHMCCYHNFSRKLLCVNSCETTCDCGCFVGLSKTIRQPYHCE